MSTGPLLCRSEDPESVHCGGLGHHPDHSPPGSQAHGHPSACMVPDTSWVQWQLWAARQAVFLLRGQAALLACLGPTHRSPAEWEEAWQEGFWGHGGPPPAALLPWEQVCRDTHSPRRESHMRLFCGKK